MTEQTLIFTSGQGPRECQIFLENAVRIFQKHVESLGGTARIVSFDAASAVVTVCGDVGSLTQWIGPLAWVCQSPVRPHHKRTRWYIEVKRKTDLTDKAVLKESDVKYSFLRAGGPGGQHQNKTESAVRATWSDPLTGRVWTVCAREERSQHRNKALALTRLKEDIQREDVKSQETALVGLHKSKKNIQRGDPVQVFTGLKFKPA
jgi:peptide chain release factor